VILIKYRGLWNGNKLMGIIASLRYKCFVNNANVTLSSIDIFWYNSEWVILNTMKQKYSFSQLFILLSQMKIEWKLLIHVHWDYITNNVEEKNEAMYHLHNLLSKLKCKERILLQFHHICFIERFHHIGGNLSIRIIY
jgi:hypothetical protein